MFLTKIRKSSIHNIALSSNRMARSDILELKRLNNGCVSYKHAAFKFRRHELMDWSRMDYCNVFISCLDSNSDGTYSLQRIHWWVRDVTLSHISPNLKETNSSNSGCAHFQQITFFGSTIPLRKKERSNQLLPVITGDMTEVGEPGTGISNAQRKPFTVCRTFWLSWGKF